MYREKSMENKGNMLSFSRSIDRKFIGLNMPKKRQTKPRVGFRVGFRVGSRVGFELDPELDHEEFEQ